jgi:LmbE family N-acetylglucosaminyl deacetylase
MTWEVFYTPHTDDESIAMAGAIARARALGHDVLVVLVTDNLASPRGARLFHRHDLPYLRHAEWSCAMRKLDVTKMETWNLPEVEMVRAPFQVQTEIVARMSNIHERLQPVHHHTVWGLHDTSYNGMGSLSHGLCANALTRFAYSRTDVRASLYAVYIYAAKKADRRAPVIRYLTEDEHRAKKDALDCYRPMLNRPGYGYKSVPELIDGAAEDPHEYLVEITP